MFKEYSIYLVMIVISIVGYTLYKFIKKDFYQNKLSEIKNLIVMLTLTTYMYNIFLYNGEFIYDMNYIKCVVIFISLTFLIFVYGIIENKDIIYKRNINLYIILYLILLISLTMVIKRVWNFDLDNLTNINSGHILLTPFYSISNFLRSDVSLYIKVYQLFGNLIAFIPLSFLLMVKDNKYKNIFRQLKIILLMIVCIEFLQLLTGTGTLDIDDVILNSGGVVMFVFLMTRFNLIDHIKKIFYFDLRLNKKIKYCLFLLTVIIPVGYIVDVFFITITKII